VRTLNARGAKSSCACKAACSGRKRPCAQKLLPFPAGQSNCRCPSFRGLIQNGTTDAVSFREDLR
jgi:hypothetical protein